jgi:hypothetical protein
MACPLAAGGAGGWVAPSEGDARYLAPEVLAASGSSAPGSSAGPAPASLDKADAFALGASLYELAAGRPLPSCGPVWAGLRAGRLGLLPAASAGFRGLVKALMAPVPADRPALAAVLRWPVLSGGGGGGGGAGARPASGEAMEAVEEAEPAPPPPAAAAAAPVPAAAPAPPAAAVAAAPTGFAPLALRPTF